MARNILQMLESVANTFTDIYFCCKIPPNLIEVSRIQLHLKCYYCDSLKCLSVCLFVCKLLFSFAVDVDVDDDEIVQTDVCVVT